MFENYISTTGSRARLRATPCSPYLDDYCDWLAARRYTPATITLYLFGIVPLGRWMATNDIAVSEFDREALAVFRRERAALGQLRHRDGVKIKSAFLGARRFQEFLVATANVRDLAVIAPSPSVLLSGFEHWMSVHRGVRPITLLNHSFYVQEFITALGEEPGCYDASSVRRFLLARAARTGVSGAKSATTAVRMFLRYLVANGLCGSSLPDALPKVADRRLAPLPRYISDEDVQRLIVSCELCALTARRDRAILLLLARLALRAGDVAGLERSDLDWREGRIRVSGKNRREFWLPLTQELGDAIAEYVRHERPVSDEPRLFLKCIAPAGPLESSVISTIVRRAIDRVGLVTPSKGAHLLRHSAATSMLRSGATLAQIGSVLRHAHIDTTAIYAKTDHALLASVATPWPEETDDLASGAPLATSEGAGTC